MAEQEETVRGVDRYGRGYFGVALPRHPAPSAADFKRDPWLAWAFAVEQAKQGNFEYVSRIMDLYDPDGDYTLNYHCAIVLGDAGPDRSFRPLVEALERRSNSDDYETDLNFSRALSIRGRLGDVPLLLRTYDRLVAVKDADIMHVFISSMLDRQHGELQDPSEFASMDDYDRKIRARHEELSEALGGPDKLVFRGELFGVVRLARRILEDLRQPFFMPDLRRRFEACTGIDCSAFFRKGELQPLAASAIVEDFLENPAAASYSDDVRYFFGRPIPP